MTTLCLFQSSVFEKLQFKRNEKFHSFTPCRAVGVAARKRGTPRKMMGAGAKRRAIDTESDVGSVRGGDSDEEEVEEEEPQARPSKKKQSRFIDAEAEAEDEEDEVGCLPAAQCLACRCRHRGHRLSRRLLAQTVPASCARCHPIRRRTTRTRMERTSTRRTWVRRR